MKSILFSLLVALITSNLQAQQAKITWTKESKPITGFVSWVSDKDMTRFGYRFEGRFPNLTEVPALVKYDDELVQQPLHEFQNHDQDLHYDTSIQVKDRIYVFSNKRERGNKSRSYFCQVFNSNTLKPEGAIINLGSFETQMKDLKSCYWISMSRDSSKIMLYGYSEESRKENSKHFMVVYDADMKKLWQNVTELPYSNGQYDLMSALITNEGKAALTVKHFEKDRDAELKKQGGPAFPFYKMKLLLYEQGISKPAEVAVEAGDKYINTLHLVNEKGDKLEFLGLYKKVHDGGLYGYFFATVDKRSMGIEIAGMNTFPPAILAQARVDGQSGSDKEPSLAPGFILSDVVQRENGTRDYILEFRYENFDRLPIDEKGIKKPGIEGWIYTYGNILVMSLAPGKPHSFARIPKWQHFKPDNGVGGFKAIPFKDKLLVFYVDGKDNLERKPEKGIEAMGKVSKSVLVMGAIDANGTLTRTIIADHKSLDVVTKIKYARHLNNNKLALYAITDLTLFGSVKERVGILEVK